MATIAGIALYTRQRLMPQINTARDEHVVGNLAANKRFARLHGVAVLLNLIQLFGVGLILFRFS